MAFTLVFLTLFALGWLCAAILPWLVLSIATHGAAGLALLPLCLLGGVTAALSVPILGADGATGLWASFPVAAGASALLLAARRFARPRRGAS